MNLFDLTDASFHYQRIKALDRLTLHIPDRTRVALLGANGSGKSTLLRMLGGLYFAESGDVRFRGEAMNEDRFGEDAFAFDFRRQVGMVFQNPDVQLFNPTVFDEVAFGPLQLGQPKSEVREQVASTLEKLRITHLKDRVPHRLSGGEKKRVALASALVLDPEVLLLDEPTASLDPRSQSQIIDLLVEWGGGVKAVITATHDLGTLEDIADLCFVLDGGRQMAQGTPDQILHDSDLLDRTNLIHVHRHRHASGEVHSHPHLHRGEH